MIVAGCAAVQVGGHCHGSDTGGLPLRGSGPVSFGSRPASASAFLRRNSICALADRSSSPAQRASASYTDGSSV